MAITTRCSSGSVFSWRPDIETSPTWCWCSVLGYLSVSLAIACMSTNQSHCATFGRNRRPAKLDRQPWHLGALNKSRSRFEFEPLNDGSFDQRNEMSFIVLKSRSSTRSLVDCSCRACRDDACGAVKTICSLRSRAQIVHFFNFDEWMCSYIILVIVIVFYLSSSIDRAINSFFLVQKENISDIKRRPIYYLVFV